MRLIRKSFSDGIRRDIFITFLGALVGFGDKAKNLHWAAPSKDIHEYLDAFYKIIEEYTDTLAESFMGILGKVEPNDIIPVNEDFNSATEFIDKVLERTQEFYNSIPSSNEYKGITSECESFIENINKYKYLFSLTDW
jgi:DNA-binding ferritin-like protein